MTADALKWEMISMRKLALAALAALPLALAGCAVDQQTGERALGGAAAGAAGGAVIGLITGDFLSSTAKGAAAGAAGGFVYDQLQRR